MAGIASINDPRQHARQRRADAWPVIVARSSGKNQMTNSILPSDFPAKAYEAVSTTVQGRRNKEPSYTDCFDAWRAVAVRFWALTEYDASFTKSISTHGAGPGEPERFAQERDLFGFFSNAMSVFEAYSLAMYVAGSWLAPAVFNAKIDEITIKRTLTAYNKIFPASTISQTLDATVRDQHFKEFKHLRIVLFHRAVRPRALFIGGPPDLMQRENIALDKTTTPVRRQHVARLLTSLTNAANTFLDNNL
jgi:hypothetical protein